LNRRPTGRACGCDSTRSRRGTAPDAARPGPRTAPSPAGDLAGRCGDGSPTVLRISTIARSPLPSAAREKMRRMTAASRGLHPVAHHARGRRLILRHASDALAMRPFRHSTVDSRRPGTLPAGNRTNSSSRRPSDTCRVARTVARISDAEQCAGQYQNRIVEDVASSNSVVERRDTPGRVLRSGITRRDAGCPSARCTSAR
jgi:hypothetical protein